MKYFVNFTLPSWQKTVAPSAQIIRLFFIFIMILKKHREICYCNRIIIIIFSSSNSTDFPFSLRNCGRCRRREWKSFSTFQRRCSPDCTWILLPAPREAQTSPSHHLHWRAARISGKHVPEDALSWCSYARTVGWESRPQGRKSWGKVPF